MGDTWSLLFTDIEGSTRRWESSPAGMRLALTIHDAIVSQSASSHAGRVIKHTGDGVFAAFGSSDDAVHAAIDIQLGLASADWPASTGRLHVRTGIHRGEPIEVDGDMFGPAVNRAARAMGVAHGDQIVLTEEARDGLGANEVMDLGTHRLKDLSGPVKLYQALHRDLPSKFPPLRSLQGFPNNLPAQLTELIGRDAEIASLTEEIERARLVTLVGPGGVGKTRLGLQIAAEVGELHEAGAWLVQLAPVSDPADVAATFATDLRIPDRPGRNPLDAVIGSFHDRNAVVIVDNCEHVIDETARAIEMMLAECPNLRIIATSRQPLRLPGEHVRDVHPLPAIDSAVYLFVERAAAASQGFQSLPADIEIIRRICERLDRLPLAIELAAARSRTWTPAEIERRLDDMLKVLTHGARTAPAHQRTLHATIEWSHGMLSDLERSVFDAVSIFAGPFDGEIAATVVEIEDQSTIEAALDELMDRSLIVSVASASGERRYRMLETIRTFGRSVLADSPDESRVRRSHLTAMAGFAHQAGRNLDGRDQRLWLQRVEDLLPDLRMAMAHARDTGFTVDGSRIAAGLFRYWYIRLAREGRDWLDVFAAHSSALPDPLHAQLLYALGSLLQLTGEYERSADVLERSVELHSDLDNPRGLAYAIHYLGRSRWGREEPQKVRASFEESMQMFEEIEDPVGHGLSLLLLGAWQLVFGDVKEALAHAVVFREMFNRIGAPQLIAHGWESDGVYRWADGRADEAFPLMLEAIPIYRKTANVTCGAHCLENTAAIIADHDPEGATELLGAVTSLRHEIGSPSPPWESVHFDKVKQDTEAVLSPAIFRAAWDRGAALDFEGALARAEELLRPTISLA